MTCRVRLADVSDRTLILRADVFDGPARAAFVDEFLADPRHHLVIAMAERTCIGFLSAVHYIHPDKPAQFWINELGVNEDHRRQGIGTGLIAKALRHARGLGCSEAWVLSDPTAEAMGFYAAQGATREGSHVALFTFDLTGA